MMQPTAVVVISFADQSIGRMQYFGVDTSNTALQREINKSVFAQPVVSWRLVKISDFPLDVDFRNAWVDNGSSLSVDIKRAREVTRSRLRAERVPRLSELDIVVFRAQEARDTAALQAAFAEKARLRDITALPAIDAAKTPQDLRAITLDTRLR